MWSSKSLRAEQAADLLASRRRSRRRSGPCRRRRGRPWRWSRSDVARSGFLKTSPASGAWPPGRKQAAEVGILAQARGRALPVAGDDLADGEALLGVARSPARAARPAACVPNLLAELVPAVDAAGDRPAQRAVVGDLLQAPSTRRASSVADRGPGRWRSGRRASSPSRPRRWRRGRRRCRTTSARRRPSTALAAMAASIGVAALLEDPDRRGGRQRLARRGHPVAGDTADRVLWSGPDGRSAASTRPSLPSHTQTIVSTSNPNAQGSWTQDHAGAPSGVASGEWRVASGEWRVASGEWRVASGEWRVASGE